MGIDPERIQLRMDDVVNGGNGEVPREGGLLVDLMDTAEYFNNRVFYAVVVA